MRQLNSPEIQSKALSKKPPVARQNVRETDQTVSLFCSHFDHHSLLCPLTLLTPQHPLTMLSDHLQTLLQEASSVSIVIDNAKCHEQGRSPLQYSHSDPLPRRRARPSRWESVPVVVCLPSHTSSSSVIRDVPPVLKCRGLSTATFTCTTSLCSLQRNATKPSRKTPGSMEIFILQSQTFPMTVNDKIKNLSTTALLDLALSDISIEDSL
jgi:hypothetical protein